MTPKEKAKQLYEKAENFIYTSNAHFAEDDCEKNCALMVVDELIERLPSINLVPPIDRRSEDNYLQYWVAVKRELNSL